MVGILDSLWGDVSAAVAMGDDPSKWRGGSDAGGSDGTGAEGMVWVEVWVEVEKILGAEVWIGAEVWVEVSELGGRGVG